MDYQHEPNPLACGQAVIAMICGKSAEEICKESGKENELTLRDMRELLEKNGFEIPEQKKSFKDKSELPKLAMLSLETPRCWHWSLAYDGIFYDPEHGISEFLTECNRRYFWKITKIN